MDLKLADKLKLAAAAGLLLITSATGLYLFLNWSTTSRPEVMPTTQPAVAAAVGNRPILFRCAAVRSFRSVG